MSKQSKACISSHLRLPQSYLFKEKPQLARWDGEAKVWRTGGFQEVLFDLGNFISTAAVEVGRDKTWFWY